MVFVHIMLVLIVNHRYFSTIMTIVIPVAPQHAQWRFANRSLLLQSSPRIIVATVYVHMMLFFKTNHSYFSMLTSVKKSLHIAMFREWKPSSCMFRVPHLVVVGFCAQYTDFEIKSEIFDFLPTIKYIFQYFNDVHTTVTPVSVVSWRFPSFDQINYLCIKC